MQAAHDKANPAAGEVGGEKVEGQVEDRVEVGLHLGGDDVHVDTVIEKSVGVVIMIVFHVPVDILAELAGENAIEHGQDQHDERLEMTGHVGTLLNQAERTTDEQRTGGRG